MVVRVSRVVIAAACLVWLAGCETTSTSDNPFAKLVAAAGKPSAASDSDVTGSVLGPPEMPRETAASRSITSVLPAIVTPRCL